MESEIVQCGDLKFKKLYTKQQIDEKVDKICAQIDTKFQKILQKDPNAKFVIMGVLNGAFMFVSQIVRRLKTTVFIDFIRVSSYKGTQSGTISIDQNFKKQQVKDSYLLIVDDICDSGKTLAQLQDYFSKNFETKMIQFATMVIRPDKKHIRQPEYVGLSCSGFIVGYGLDYNQYGRQYAQIYQKYDE